MLWIVWFGLRFCPGTFPSVQRLICDLLLVVFLAEKKKKKKEKEESESKTESKRRNADHSLPSSFRSNFSAFFPHIKMVSKVIICFDPIHNSFRDQPPLNIEPIDEFKPALKIIRAALRAMEIDPESSDDYELRRCRCNGEGIVAEEDLVARRLKVQDMKWNDVERLFLRKVQVEETEIEMEQDEDIKVKFEESEDENKFIKEDWDEMHSENDDDENEEKLLEAKGEEDDEKENTEDEEWRPTEDYCESQKFQRKEALLAESCR